MDDQLLRAQFPAYAQDQVGQRAQGSLAGQPDSHQASTLTDEGQIVLRPVRVARGPSANDPLLKLLDAVPFTPSQGVRSPSPKYGSLHPDAFDFVPSAQGLEPAQQAESTITSYQHTHNAFDWAHAFAHVPHPRAPAVHAARELQPFSQSPPSETSSTAMCSPMPQATTSQPGQKHGLKADWPICARVPPAKGGERKGGWWVGGVPERVVIGTAVAPHTLQGEGAHRDLLNPRLVALRQQQAMHERPASNSTLPIHHATSKPPPPPPDRPVLGPYAAALTSPPAPPPHSHPPHIGWARHSRSPCPPPCSSQQLSAFPEHSSSQQRHTSSSSSRRRPSQPPSRSSDAGTHKGGGKGESERSSTASPSAGSPGQAPKNKVEVRLGPDGQLIFNARQRRTLRRALQRLHQAEFALGDGFQASRRMSDQERHIAVAVVQQHIGRALPERTDIDALVSMLLNLGTVDVAGGS